MAEGRGDFTDKGGLFVCLLTNVVPAKQMHASPQAYPEDGVVTGTPVDVIILEVTVGAPEDVVSDEEEVKDRGPFGFVVPRWGAIVVYQ